MRYAIVIVSVMVLVAASCAAWERLREDVATPEGKIPTAVREGGERFADHPSAGTAASWGMEVLLAVLSVATGGLGLTQLRDRNARRRVEGETHELQRLVAALGAAFAKNPTVAALLRKHGFPPLSEEEMEANFEYNTSAVHNQAGGGGA
jgi:hypothetical protein